MGYRVGHRFLIRVCLLLAALAGGIFTTAQVSADPARWMAELANDPAYAGGLSPLNQTLEQFIFPGSHDAGTYRMKLAPACEGCNLGPLGPILEVPGLEVLFGALAEPWSSAQTDSILEQLLNGSRAFDLRFFEATASDVSAAQDLSNRILSVFPQAGDWYDLTPIVAGEYYIHHTFAGPSSTEIFSDIKSFLVAAGHDQEVIILRLSSMKSGSGGMSGMQVAAFLREMFNTIGPEYFVEWDPATGANRSLASIITDSARPQQQVIVALDGTAPTWELADQTAGLDHLVWPKFAHAYSGTYETWDDDNDEDTPEVYDPDHSVITSSGGYPRAADWNSEARLLDWMRKISAQRELRTQPAVALGHHEDYETDMFIAFAQFGPDDTRFRITPPFVDPIELDAPGMLVRRVLCNYTELGREVIDAIVAYVEALTGAPIPVELVDIITLINDGLNGLVTGILVEEALDEAGICTAINDDWDRFRSLTEVADFTNPKVIPALIELPRDDVNIVMVDEYPVAFTTTAQKLNRGAARVSVTILELLELECHDCIPPNGPGDPDYFPRITFTGDEWPVWGGPWLEKTGDRITPNWRASRAVPPFVSNAEVTLQVWDQDNEPFPDDISQIDGNATSITRSLVPWDPARRTVNLIPGFELSSRGEQTSCSIGGDFPWIDNCSLEFDSSRIVYQIHVCKWAPEPGGVRDTNSCDFDFFADNQPPVAALEIALNCRPSMGDCTPPIGPDVGFVYEGQVVRVDAGGSNDPDAASDPIFLGDIWKYEYDCAYDPTPICLSADDPELIGNPPVNTVCEEGFDYVADGFVPYRGCRNAAEFDNGTIVGLFFNPADGVCIDPATGIPESNCGDRSAFGKQMTMALRVTDGGGKSDIATADYPVLNLPPAVTRFEIAQVPGQPTVTVKAEFTDNGLDDSPFNCLFYGFDGVTPGNATPGKLDDPTVSVVVDPLTGWYRTFYTCEVTWENIPPGDYTAFVAIEDKDVGDSALHPGVPFSVDLPPVSVATDGALGSLRNIIALSSANDVITFDPSLSGAMIVLTAGEILISKELTIDASNLPDGLTIDANGNSRVFNIGAPAVLKGLTITGGNGAGLLAGRGGCIRNTSLGIRNEILVGLEIIDTTITGCSANEGGGIFNSGQLDIIRSTISNNTAASAGGGIYTWRGLNLDSTTLHGNSTSGGGGGLFAFNGNGVPQSAPVNITNSTISGNVANDGGGISINTATPTITHSTIANNRAVQSGGGIYHNVGGVDLVLENSVIAGNTARTSNLPSGPDIMLIQPAVSAVGNNLIGINESVETAFPAGALAGTRAAPLDARLNGLSVNLGPTLTMMPFLDSPTIDNAVFLAPSSPATDQRGFDRMVEGPNDLGAVERLAADVDDRDPDNDLVDVTSDNCPTVRNEDQADTDFDGVGDLCEPISVLTDEVAGSLRDIVSRAADGHVITFHSAASGGTIILTGGELLVDRDLTIDASSLTDGITISGDANNDGLADAGDTRVFNIGTTANVVLKDVTVTRGYADLGGCMVNSGNLELVDSTVSGCTAAGGGGIKNSGTLTLTNSTVWINQADVGGGIFNLSAAVSLVNSTVSGNQAASGGGIANVGSLTMIHSTLSNNSASGNSGIGGGGLWQAASGYSQLIQNSIIAGNSADFGPDIHFSQGDLIIEGANLIGNNDTVGAFFSADDPLVGTPANPLRPLLNPLGNYGGPTLTMLPAAASLAINKAVTTTGSPVTDQRGLGRLIGVASDLGAVERRVSDVDPDPDSDGDGVPDPMDSCSGVSNASQRDSDNDGYGNDCDPDFDGNFIVNAADLAFFKTKFFTPDPDADLNGDGVVNAADLAILKTMFFKAPGPSGLVP